MIYTLTCNPAIDHIVYLGSPLRPGETNRAASERLFIGGKGNNVSRVLKELGTESTAFGFLAGFTGEEIRRGLEEAGIRSAYIFLPEGQSRINVKLKSPGEQILETEVNGVGPAIPEGYYEKLLQSMEETISEGDYLVLSGSIPASLPADTYEQILERLSGKGIRFVVDASGELLRKTLRHAPFLVKPNKEELEGLFGRSLESDEDVIRCAKELQMEGAGYVLVSMAGDGAILLTPEGEVTKAPAVRGTPVNSVGAGDSMVAGFLAGFLRSGDVREALRLGTAAAAATVFSEDLAGREEIDRILASMK